MLTLGSAVFQELSKQVLRCCFVLSQQDLSPGSVEEAEEAEPDDEFKDAIEVNRTLTF